MRPKSLNGSFFQHFDNGRPASRGEYKNGHKHGLWLVWDKKGHRRFEAAWQQGKQHGATRAFHPSGELALTGHFQNGEKHGLFTLFHENGQRAAFGHYRRGKRQGIWTFCNSDGLCTHTRCYHDGLIVDEFNSPIAA
jgi:antitoxin component YwqK of YwqJK toxin-antitoxin module